MWIASLIPLSPKKQRSKEINATGEMMFGESKEIFAIPLNIMGLSTYPPSSSIHTPILKEITSTGPALLRIYIGI